jgi:excisionase family DNA binding protein
MNQPDRLLRVTTASKSLGVSDDTIRRWFDIGKLSGIEIQNPARRTIRIYKSSVDRLKEARTT